MTLDLTQTMPPTPKSDILAWIRARRDEFTPLRHVPQDAVAMLKELGIYRPFVPRALGGLEMSPDDFCRLVEEIATADASIGWVASFGVSTFYLARLPRDTFTTLYGNDTNLVFAEALFPPQEARINGKRIGITGRWKYCSGVMGASFIGVGLRHESWDKAAQPCTAVMPAEEMTIHDNWQAIGLRASGRHDISVTDRSVTRDWMLARNALPSIDTAAFRYPLMRIVPASMAEVGLGTAREALDTLAATARGEASISAATSWPIWRNAPLCWRQHARISTPRWTRPRTKSSRGTNWTLPHGPGSGALRPMPRQRLLGWPS